MYEILQTGIMKINKLSILIMFVLVFLLTGFLFKQKIIYWYYTRELKEINKTIDECVYLCRCPNWGACYEECESVVKKLKLECPEELWR